MTGLSRKAYERIIIETIVDIDGILSLNEKQIEEKLEHNHQWEIAIKNHSDQRKHKSELVWKPKKQVNRIFIGKKPAIKVIMDCIKTSPHKLRTRLRFKHSN